jgi:hypothetical protein
MMSATSSAASSSSSSASLCPLRVTITSNLLSLLVDEAYRATSTQPHNGAHHNRHSHHHRHHSPNHNTMGLLLGNATALVKSSTSDAQESVTKLQPTTSVTGYQLGLHSHNSSNNNSNRCVGIFQCRRDGLVNPSFRAVAAAIKHSKHVNTTSSSSAADNRQETHPFLVLVINASVGSNSWILGLSYALYAVQKDG